MNILKDLQKRIAGIHTRRQSAYYKKLRRDTQVAKLQKERNERLLEATKAKKAATRELRTSKSPRKKLRFSLGGDLSKFAGKLPSDEELNRTIFGSSEGPRRPK